VHGAGGVDTVTIPSAIVTGVGFQIAGVVDNRFAAAGLDAGLFTVFTSTGACIEGAVSFPCKIVW
jgi:hypothetical protein